MPSPLFLLQKACRLLRALSDARNTRLTDRPAPPASTRPPRCACWRRWRPRAWSSATPTPRPSAPARWLALRAAALHRIDPRALARPALIRLAQQFEDTALLSVPSGWESICIELRLGSFPIRANYTDIGSRRRSASAPAAPCSPPCSDAEVEAALQCWRPRSSATRASARRCCGEVEATRERGYAVLLDVVVERMGGIAVALPDPDGYPLAALSIAALNERISERETALARALRREADAVCAAGRRRAAAAPACRAGGARRGPGEALPATPAVPGMPRMSGT